MTTLVLDDLSTPQREVLAAMPIRDSREWRTWDDAGFTALRPSPGSPRALHCPDAAHEAVDRRPVVSGSEIGTDTSTGAGA